MKKNDLSTTVLKTIKDKKIKPKARWTFILKNWTWWLLALLCLFLGSIVFTLIIFFASSGDFSLERMGGGHDFKWGVIMIPYVIVILFGILIALIYYNIKHTRTGYKYQFLPVIASLIVISIIGGVLLNVRHIGRSIDNEVAQRSRFYAQHHPRHKAWIQPDKGRLAGRIMRISHEGLVIKNPIGEYLVIYDDDLGLYHVGMMVFMDGELDEDNNRLFYAKHISEFPEEFQERKPPFQIQSPERHPSNSHRRNR